MHVSTLRNVGGSVMVALPKAMLESLGLAARDEVDIDLKDGKLVLEPRKQPKRRRSKYTLAELLAQCDINAPEHPEAIEWERMPPVGKEIW
jgi:antitoxin ChpS